jgi:hypothetical protein
VYEGINLHKERLKRGREEKPSGFFLMADALVERDQWLADNLMPACTQDEYPAYVWKVRSDGRIQDEPNKALGGDDGVDCDRYLTMFKDWKGKARVTVLNM